MRLWLLKHVRLLDSHRELLCLNRGKIAFYENSIEIFIVEDCIFVELYVVFFVVGIIVNKFIFVYTLTYLSVVSVKTKSWHSRALPLAPIHAAHSVVSLIGRT